MVCDKKNNAYLQKINSKSWCVYERERERLTVLLLCSAATARAKAMRSNTKTTASNRDEAIRSKTSIYITIHKINKVRRDIKKKNRFSSWDQWINLLDTNLVQTNSNSRSVLQQKRIAKQLCNRWLTAFASFRVLIN